MLQILDKTIRTSFYLLFFLVPLVFYPHTSELFEFNKMILVYVFTSVILGSWVAKSVIEKKLIFQKSLLDIPLAVFLGSQGISTLLSIDFRTSLLGFYSRFNGGLMSSISYAILYWAFVSNMDRKKTLSAIYYLFATGLLVSLYGILEHFGVSLSCLFVTGKADTACWVQDVQNRVFATIGQPNWLGAWIVALSPIAWALALNSNFKLQISKLQLKVQNYIWPFISSIFFLVLLYTKSRSGLLGFGVAFLIFWGLSFLKSKKVVLKPFIIHVSLFLILAVLIGTPWTPALSELQITNYQLPTREVGPALETGGTESGEIRKIVWKGAVDLWKRYPIFGSGVETFGFSYYETRPSEHNLVSEWDFLYNKAHNEYLNFAATTGSIGLLAYILFIIFTILQMTNAKWPMSNSIKDLSFSIYSEPASFAYPLAFLSGFVSILVSNFFGFSVVPVSLLFFLFPAMTVTITNNTEHIEKKGGTTSGSQKVILVLILCTILYTLFIIYRYWQADLFYKKGKTLNDSGQFIESRKILIQSNKLSPNEAIFLNELSKSVGNLTVLLEESDRADEAKQGLDLFTREAESAMRLSPRNLNIKRDVVQMYTKLSSVDQIYLIKANRLLEEMVKAAPTDPKIKFNLAKSYLQLGQNQKAEELLLEVISAKPNYKEARFTYAAILADKNEIGSALAQLDYILENIDPNDDNIREFREEIERLR